MALSFKGEQDKKLVLIDSAVIIAEHVYAFGGEVEDFREEVMRLAQEQLDALREDAAREAYYERKAEELGLRY